MLFEFSVLRRVKGLYVVAMDYLLSFATVNHVSSSTAWALFAYLNTPYRSLIRTEVDSFREARTLARGLMHNTDRSFQRSLDHE
jgi:hypothetical protein